MSRLLASLMLVVLLSGCIDDGSKVTTTTKPSGPEPVTEEDITTVKTAITEKDITTCNQMGDQFKRDWCYWTVALASNNQEICEQIQHDTYTPGCYMGIAIATNNPSICDKISLEDHPSLYATKNRCRAVVNGDLSACDELSGSAQRNTCYLTVGTALKDMSVCEKISNQETKDLCIHEVTA